jgi:hypothetical protein
MVNIQGTGRTPNVTHRQNELVLDVAAAIFEADSPQHLQFAVEYSGSKLMDFCAVAIECTTGDTTHLMEPPADYSVAPTIYSPLYTKEGNFNPDNPTSYLYEAVVIACHKIFSMFLLKNSLNMNRV